MEEKKGGKNEIAEGKERSGAREGEGGCWEVWKSATEEEEQYHPRGRSEPRGTMDARNLLRQFKNIGNYLRLLFDPDVYGLCKLYPVTGWTNPLPSSPFADRVARSYCSNDILAPRFVCVLRSRGDRSISLMNIQRAPRAFLPWKNVSIIRSAGCNWY